MPKGKPVFHLLWRAFIFVSVFNLANSQWYNCYNGLVGDSDYCDRNNPKDDTLCCDGTTHPMAFPVVSYLKRKAFCDELFRDDDTGWTRYFSGYIEDGTPVQRQNWAKVCGKIGLLYRTQTADNKVAHYGNLREYTNRLRFTDSVIAQEGLSFCVVGSHYRKSAFSLWDPLKPFLPLAEKSFDIGNHIDPEDSAKMNTFKRPNPGDLRRFGPSEPNKCTSQDIWCGTRKIPTHRFEYVWLGQHQVNDPLSREHFVPLSKGFEKRPAHPEWQPDENCQNPYRVSTTLIESDGLTLHNYLHIKVYAEPVSQPNGKNCPTGKIKLLMLEVRDQDGLPVGQFTDDIPCDKDERTTSTHLTCPSGATCRSYQGTKMNVVPCMFSHPKSVVHPTIFMMAAGGSASASAGGSGPGPGGAPSPSPSSSDDVCRDSQKEQSQRNPPTVKYKDNPDQYFTEVHATWRFAQMDESWVSQLHFATLIIEDETPIQYYTSRLTYWDGVGETKTCRNSAYWHCSHLGCYCYEHACCWFFPLKPPLEKTGRFQLGLLSSCVNETYNINRPYGYSARYTMLRPTFHTRGGWDFFRKQYISPLDVDCHVDIAYGSEYYYEMEDENNPDKLGKLPLRKTLSDFLKDKYSLDDSHKYQPPKKEKRYGDGSSVGYRNVYELPDWHCPGMSRATDGTERVHVYYSVKPEWAAIKMFDSAHQDPATLTTEFDEKPFREYFGSRYILPATPVFNPDVTKLQTTIGDHDHDQEFTMDEMTKDSKSRCPCPFIPTTPPPELATKPPVEIEGRRTHFVNMAIAWVILVPLAFFISRFFKETYSRVFFLQEFWWLAIHILTLITALLFSLGSIYALKAKRSLGDPYEVVWTDATVMHIYFGYGVLGLFLVHLLLGSFRFSNTQLRMLQIGLHWLFGWLEYLFAVGSIMAAAAIPSGVMSCWTFGIYCGFIFYQTVFTLGMEYHMRKVDELLELNPPRTYLPPPVMRVFHRDAPHAKFRVIMLIVFVVGCFLFYSALHVSMNWPGGEVSCFQPTKEETAEEVEA